jgi:hypothetical protein
LHELMQDLDADLDIADYVHAAGRVQRMVRGYGGMAGPTRVDRQGGWQTELAAALGRHRDEGVDAAIVRAVMDECLKRKGTLKQRLQDMFVRGLGVRAGEHEVEVVVEARVTGA